MSLPFLKPKTSPSVIEMKRKPDGKAKTTAIDGEGLEDHAHTAVGEDLLRAIKANDAKGVGRALKAHYDIASSSDPDESMPESQQDFGLGGD